MREMTLGVDLSDTKARVVVVNGEGKVMARSEHAAGNLAAGVRDRARRAIGTARGTVSALAVAVPLNGDAIPGDVASALAEVSPSAPLPLVVSAGTAAVLAEHWCGAARGLSQVVTFSIGDHVTAGILINGEPWLGAHGMAGAVGWLAMNPVEREDYRRYGGLEAEISAAGIVRRLVWRVKSGDQSAVVDGAGGDVTRLKAEDVFKGALAGDGVCISVVRDTTKYVGMAIANLATMLDPETIVLGGALATSGEHMLDAIRVECARRLRPAQADGLQLVLSPLGDDAVAIGAACAALRSRA